jgi:hypothetical protein
MSQSNCRRLAYADPPYLGCAKRYREHPDAARWDDAAAHGELMAELERDYDGWALSAGASSLPHLLPLAPAGIRVAAWVKPFSAYKKNVRIPFGWEPVIFKPARRLSDPDAPEARDWLSCNMATQRGLVGAKPWQFCRWVLDLLGYLEGDRVDDLFPGTGIMAAVIAQRRLPLVNGHHLTRPEPLAMLDV